MKRRVFVSMPADVWLEPHENRLKWAIVEKIEQRGYVPEIFTDPTGRSSLSAHLAWSADAATSVMRRCQGAALIGFPRWHFDAADGPVFLPTEFSHYEGALARSLGLPVLVLAQQRLLRRVVFDGSFGHYIQPFPDTADESWVTSDAFRVAFEKHWMGQMEKRRDVFLGYCGRATAVAKRLRDHLETTLQVSVLDWQRDFQHGRSILEEIESASARASAGIFLFTKDDVLGSDSAGGASAPRDNVVFEAGYFAAAKGKSRVLIVREAGAKMPDDLGGDIYAFLEDRADLGPLQSELKRFVEGI